MRYYLIIILLGVCFHSFGQPGKFIVSGRIKIDGVCHWFEVSGDIRVNNVTWKQEKFATNAPYYFGSGSGVPIEAGNGTVTLTFKINGPYDLLISNWDKDLPRQSKQYWDLEAIMLDKIIDGISSANPQQTQEAYQRFKHIVPLNIDQWSAIYEVYLRFIGGFKNDPMEALNIYTNLLNTVGPTLTHKSKEKVFSGILALFIQKTKMRDPTLISDKIFSTPLLLQRWKNIVAGYRKTFQIELGDSADLGSSNTPDDVLRQWNTISQSISE